MLGMDRHGENSVPGHAVAATFVFVTALIIRLYLFSKRNFILVNDSRLYIRMCEIAASDPVEGLIIGKGVFGPEYLGFTVIFCSFRMVTESVAAWILFQVVLSAVTTVVVFYTAKQVLGTAGGLVAGGTLAAFYEVFRFTQWVMAETVFTFAVALVLFVLTYNYTHPDRQYRALAWAAVVWMAITRPIGPPILFLWLVHDAVRSDAAERVLVRASQRRATGIFFIAVSIWTYASQWVGSTGLVEKWRQGWIYSGGEHHNGMVGPGTWSYDPRPADGMVEFAIMNADHLFLSGLVKVGVFFLPFITGSLAGPLKNTFAFLNIFVATPVFLLSGYAAVKLYRADDRLFAIWLTPLVGTLFVTAVTFVPDNMRYRAPMGPVFAILTAYALVELGAVSMVRERLSHLLDGIRPDADGAAE